MAVLAGQRLTAQMFLDNTRHTVPGGYNAVNANSVTATAETVYITTGTLTLRTGRAYGLTLSHLIKGTSPDTARLLIKRNNTSGSTIFDTQGVPFPVSGSNGRVTFEGTAANNTGADISTALVATFQRNSGSAAGVSVPASTTSPAYLLVEDIGAATDYASATPIT